MKVKSFRTSNPYSSGRPPSASHAGPQQDSQAITAGARCLVGCQVKKKMEKERKRRIEYITSIACVASPAVRSLQSTSPADGEQACVMH